MKLTIQHIAARAGVSKGTVSRVINARTTVAASTRVRVLAVMEELGYRPDPAARELSMRTQHTLGLSLARAERRLAPYFVLFRQALFRELQELGIPVEELDEDLASYKRLPSAVLVMSAGATDPRLEFLLGAGITTVLVGHHESLSCVAPADEDGAYQATRHLLELGHREVALLSGASSLQGVMDRERGFTRALTHYDTKKVAHLVGNFELLGGYRAVRRAWETGERFTALFCESDEMAVGAIAALEDLGVQVPQQVSVVGFDGMPELPYSLTTIRQDIPSIARGAAQLIIEALSGQTPRSIISPVTLSLGATTAPPHPAMASSRARARV
jgi:LacI family transcriptional regulator